MSIDIRVAAPRPRPPPPPPSRLFVPPCAPVKSTLARPTLARQECLPCLRGPPPACFNVPTRLRPTRLPPTEGEYREMWCVVERMPQSDWCRTTRRHFVERHNKNAVDVHNPTPLLLTDFPGRTDWKVLDVRDHVERRHRFPCRGIQSWSAVLVLF